MKYAILGTFDWRHYVEESWLVDNEFPYVVLASRLIDYFNVNVSIEIVHFTKASSEITKRHLKKLGMRFVDHGWIIAGEPPAVGNME